jgi:hypothetical protein
MRVVVRFLVQKHYVVLNLCLQTHTFECEQKEKQHKKNQ